MMMTITTENDGRMTGLTMTITHRIRTETENDQNDDDDNDDKFQLVKSTRIR